MKENELSFSEIEVEGERRGTYYGMKIGLRFAKRKV